jgi:hypothetical protein
MTTATTTLEPAPRRNLWRIILLILLLIPALPALVLFKIALLGKIAGCDVQADAACFFGGIALGDAAKRALGAAAGFAAFFVFLGGFWLLLCLYPIQRSFQNAGVRLIAALIAAGWSVIGAIIAGLAALGTLAPHCSFNEGGVGTCRLFGVITREGHNIGTALWGVFLGMPIAALVFIVYAIIVAVRAGSGKQKTLTFPPRS